MSTRLGLAGISRRGPLFKQFGSSVGRPGTLRFSQLALTGVPGRKKHFTAKSGGTSGRPPGVYSSRSLVGIPLSRRPAFTAKASAKGVVGRVTLTLTPHATVTVSRRYGMTADVVLSIRPIGAVITVAHRSFVSGRTTMSLRPQATGLLYHRQGVSRAMQGNTAITITPFGNMIYRRYRVTLGSTLLTLTPQATLKYTPAGQRNNHVNGRTTLRLTPQAGMTFIDGGIAYAIAATNSLSLVPSAHIQVTRETTFRQHGHTTISLTPHGTITKTTGPPVAYAVQGSTTLTLTPNGIMGVQLGIIEQHAIQGGSPMRLTPQGRVLVTRAPTITPIDLTRPGRRSFIRIFR